MDQALRLLIDLAIVGIFLVGIWRFRDPRSARAGNLTVAFALLCGLALVAVRAPLGAAEIVLPALALGSLAGWGIAARVNMIQIPAMVALQNGAGGLAALLVAYVELTRGPAAIGVGEAAGVLGLAVGAVTFSGSAVAAGKLAGLLMQRALVVPGHAWLVGIAAAATVVAGAVAPLVAAPALRYLLAAEIGLALGVGILFSMRVGGADMPVLISWLNSLSGLAAALCGIVVENRLLIVCGSTVAASGFVLTSAMCRAMNRSLRSVVLGASGTLGPMAVPQAASAAEPPPADEAPARTTPPQDEAERAAVPQQETRRGESERDKVGRAEAAGEQPTGDESPLGRAVKAARGAEQIIVVPGYGMALAHAQFETARLADRLRAMGKRVRFAVHPIAGRMPGHMHVLLAEAEVDPDLLFDLEEINADFPDTDLAVIVGACDVVNPAAIHVPDTPITGMPILAAHEARQVLVCNLDDRPGYSGVENPLYSDPKTILLLGDAKGSLMQLLEALSV